MQTANTDKEKIGVIKREIIEMVHSMQGCKAVELFAAITKWLYRQKEEAPFSQNGGFPSSFITHEFIMKLIEELVKEGELIEIQYNLPRMDYRNKSFLLPKGSIIINQKDNGI